MNGSHIKEVQKTERLEVMVFQGKKGERKASTVALQAMGVSQQLVS